MKNKKNNSIPLIKRYIFTLIISFLGAICAIFLSIPLPWMLGPIICICIASRFKNLPLQNPRFFISPARVAIGVTIGSTFTPQLLAHIDKYILSLIYILPMVVCIGVIGTWYYHKIQKFDLMSAYFSAMPGGLLEMVLIGKDMGANVSKVTLTQTTRLFLIILSLPFLIEYTTHINLGGLKPVTSSIINIPLKELIFMVLIGICGVYLAKNIRLFGPYILGPMIVSICAYSFGLIENKPPDEIIKTVQLLIGTSIGFTFYGINGKTILKTIYATFGFFILLIIICGIFIGIVHCTLHFPLLASILAFSPGGQADISLMAIIIGEDVPFIILHHIIRLTIVIGFAGIFARYLKKI